MQPNKKYPDPLDCRLLRLHEAIFKGFDGGRVIGPAKIFLKPYLPKQWAPALADGLLFGYGLT